VAIVAWIPISLAPEFGDPSLNVSLRNPVRIFR